MDETEKKMRDILDQYKETVSEQERKYIETVLLLLTQGKTVIQAVDLALKTVPLTATTQAATVEAVYQAACAGYGILPKFVSAPSEVKKRLLSDVWVSDGMKLSERLHGASLKMRRAIIDTINDSFQKQKSVKQIAMELYDGYNSGKKVIKEQELPAYLKRLKEAAARVCAGDHKALKEFNSALKAAEAEIKKFTARDLAGAPNKMIAAQYKKFTEAAVKAVETMNAKAMEKAAWVAVQEKSRAQAEVIARTESARAWFDGFVAKHKDDPMVAGFKWKLSSRHHMVPFDQCDVCANMNVGHGPGVYAKNNVPPLPRHPHCLCHLVVVYIDELEGTFNPDGANEYLDSLSQKQRQALFGIEGEEQYQRGVNWQVLLRGWDGFKDPASRLEKKLFEEEK